MREIEPLSQLVDQFEKQTCWISVAGANRVSSDRTYAGCGNCRRSCRARTRRLQMWRSRMKLDTHKVLALVAFLALAQPATADVITDWNEEAVAYVLGRNLGPPPAERIMAMAHVAMFDAVNSIER